MQASKEISVQNSILDIQDQGLQVLLVTSDYKIYLIDRAMLEIVEETTVTKGKDPLHAYSHAMCLSSKGYCNVPMRGSKKSVLIGSQPKMHKAGINKSHNGNIEASHFSEDSRYLATGGDDGKVYVFDVPTLEMVASLPSRPDYPHIVHLSEDREMVASCSYDKNIYLFNIDRHKPIASFFADEVVQVAGFLALNRLLYFATRSGNSVLYDIKNKQILNSKEQMFKSWPTALSVTLDDRYVLVATREEVLHIIRIPENEQVASIQLQKKGVTNLLLLSDFLLVTFDDGTIRFYDTQTHLASMEVELKLKKYEEAAKYVEKNPLLMLHSSYRIFDEAWEDMFFKFRQLVSGDKMIEAMKIVKPFLFDETKKAEVDRYVNSKENAMRFNQLVRKKDFVSALLMADSMPDLQTLPQFGIVMQHWEKLFKSCKKALMEDFKKNRGQVEMKLAPFRRVPSLQEVIESLLQNPRLFAHAERLIKEKKFSEYFALTQKYPVLEASELHKKIGILTEKLEKDFERAMNNEDYELAEEIANALMEFPESAMKIKDELIKIKQIKQMDEAFSKNDFLTAFKIIEIYPELKTTVIYKDHREKIESIFKQARKMASKGKVKETVMALKDIRGISYYKEKVRSIQKFSFLSLLEMALEKNNKEMVQKALREYLKQFGKDDDIKITCARLELDTLLARMADSL